VQLREACCVVLRRECVYSHKDEEQEQNTILKSQIMKKALLTCGLFSLMLVLTSFKTEIGEHPENQSRSKEGKKLESTIGEHPDNQSRSKESKKLEVAIGEQTENQSRSKESKKLELAIGGQTENQSRSRESKRLELAIGEQTENRSRSKESKKLEITTHSVNLNQVYPSEIAILG